jgi:hypothetical protein
MPNGIMQLMRTAREKNSGVENARGEMVLAPDEIAPLATFWEALGFTSSDRTVRSVEAGIQFRYSEHFKAAAAQLNSKYHRAVADGDVGEQRALEQQFQALQRQKVKLRIGKATPLSTFIKNGHKKVKTADGVKVAPGMDGFMEDLTGEEVE